MSSVDIIALQFQEMSKQRDAEVRCTTESTCVKTDDGYVTDIVSKSPRTLTPSGETFQTVTKRRSVTKGNTETGNNGATQFRDVSPIDASRHFHPSVSPPPQFPMTPSAENQNTAANPVNRPRSLAAQIESSPTHNKQLSRPMPLDENGNCSYSTNGPSTQSRSLTSSSPSYRPAATTQWEAKVRHEPIYNNFSPSPYSSLKSSSSPALSSTSKNVGFGVVKTAVVEPSRISPLKVENVYAPVKYVTKRELRRIRQQQSEEEYNSTFASRIRSSSVPRLDSIYESGGRQFSVKMNPPHQPQPQQQSRGAVPLPFEGRPLVDVDRYHFYNQPSVEEIDASSSERRMQKQRQPVFSSPPNSYGSPPYQPPVIQNVNDPYEAKAFYPENQPRRSSAGGVRRQTPVRRSTPSTQRPDYLTVYEEYAVPSQQRQISSPQYSAPREVPQYQNGPSPMSQSTPEIRYKVLPVVDNIDVESVGKMLANARSVPLPSPPPYCDDAFRLLNRGTYLIKYGRQGNPHERYFSIRILQDEVSLRYNPYLVWRTHRDAVGIKERLHLSHVVAVGRGTANGNFRRHLYSEQLIKGPYTGSKQPTLPTTYAFSIVFQSYSSARTVDLLALDDQTYQCWLLVFDYLASINTQQGATVPVDVETIAPDTPRSQSASSQAGY